MIFGVGNGSEHALKIFDPYKLSGFDFIGIF